MATAITPGPWRAEKRGQDLWMIFAGEGQHSRPTICVMGDGNPAQCEANARLIAAAPELADVAARCVVFFQDTDAPIGIAARVAILKATGG